MKNLKFGLLGALALSLVLVSCSKDEETQPNETNPTANLTKEVPQHLVDVLDKMEMNTNFVRYGTFHFPDGTTEERIFVEEDVVLTEDQILDFGKQLADATDERQYRTFNLVSQGRNISIIGYTGGSQALSSKARTALQWAVNNYNRLNGVSISFTLTFGTNYQSKDMVVYDNSINNPGGAGGSAGFPSNGLPYKFVQIYNLDGYSTNVNEHVITHEIGHSVGFRHTDWFSRQSCGQNVNEGSGSVGAVHVNGTPTGYDSSSIMLACFSSGASGEFNSNDITALNNMY
ncbi:M57 family metalloprotease [Altibacter sp. HG106]|uniref:M57 family metalloprotease n=1 Tax=Altibacter sp. HG106 TaxID=3023937 RepID=UPI002350C6A3|nr:M57 family metalloprotease [Altibacter sp. HG106]MDC7995816.1 M57 family metalloprotease [Altibacter sp. HG106]